MKYQIAICDDSEIDVEYLKSLLEEWQKTHSESFLVSSFPSAESFLFQYEDEKKYDILLLDVEMKEMNGVELAKKVRKIDENIPIIFITGYSDYIADGYDVDALQYLMKPLKKEKFFETLDRAIQKCKKNEIALYLKTTEGTEKVLMTQIQYVEAQQNYFIVHGKKNYMVRGSLNEFEKELDSHFYRMGRSYIVNLAWITKITREQVYLSSGVILSLPRGHYDSLNQAFISQM